MAHLKGAMQKHSRGTVERNQLTFDAMHHYLPDFPVVFDVCKIKNVRKKLTVGTLLTRFGSTPLAKKYYHMLRDYAHQRDAGYDLAMIFSFPDLVAAVDGASKVREPNHVKAAVLHADSYDDDDTHGARFVWRADTSALPAYVKLDPPILVIETLSSYLRRILSRINN